jgi:hypothetical protein
MMGHDPANLEKELHHQNYVVVRKRKMKMVLPAQTDSDVEGLETIME